MEWHSKLQEHALHLGSHVEVALSLQCVQNSLQICYNRLSMFGESRAAYCGVRTYILQAWESTVAVSSPWTDAVSECWNMDLKSKTVRTWIYRREGNGFVSDAYCPKITSIDDGRRREAYIGPFGGDRRWWTSAVPKDHGHRPSTERACPNLHEPTAIARLLRQNDEERWHILSILNYDRCDNLSFKEKMFKIWKGPDLWTASPHYLLPLNSKWICWQKPHLVYVLLMLSVKREDNLKLIPWLTAMTSELLSISNASSLIDLTSHPINKGA